MASSSRLKPGEKGKLTVSVDVKDKVGSLTKTVQVSTNDPKNPVITLVIRVAAKSPGQ